MIGATCIFFVWYHSHARLGMIPKENKQNSTWWLGLTGHFLPPVWRSRALTGIFQMLLFTRKPASFPRVAQENPSVGASLQLLSPERLNTNPQLHNQLCAFGGGAHIWNCLVFFIHHVLTDTQDSFVLWIQYPETSHLFLWVSIRCPQRKFLLF